MFILLPVVEVNSLIIELAVAGEEPTISLLNSDFRLLEIDTRSSLCVNYLFRGLCSERNTVDGLLGE